MHGGNVLQIHPGRVNLVKWLGPKRQAEGAIFQYINEFYNLRRPHSLLGGTGPLAFEQKVA